MWRFKFGSEKTKCMVTGKNPNCFISDPTWYMGSSILKTASNIDILGVNFSSSGKYDDFMNNRIQKCKRSMFALSGIGMSYPGLDTLNKANLFKSICRPTPDVRG